jgi:hypothetical protein
VTARGTFEFRRDHDYRMVPKKKVYVSRNPGLYDPDFAYGINTKFALFLVRTLALFFVRLFLLGRMESCAR